MTTRTGMFAIYHRPRAQPTRMFFFDDLLSIAVECDIATQSVEIRK